MACGACWQRASGGEVDGTRDTPHYRYGGLWKNHHAAMLSGRGKVPKPGKQARAARGDGEAGPESDGREGDASTSGSADEAGGEPAAAQGAAAGAHAEAEAWVAGAASGGGGTRELLLREAAGRLPVACAPRMEKAMSDRDGSSVVFVQFV
jgi:hypothetical protein